MAAGRVQGADIAQLLDLKRSLKFGVLPMAMHKAFDRIWPERILAGNQ